MMTALAFLAVAQTFNPVVEAPLPEAGFVSVQAIIKLPPLSGHERVEALLLADTIADDVEGYSRLEMGEIAAMAGESLKVTVMPDHMRISFGVPPSELGPALTYIDQILRGSKLKPDVLNRAMEEIPFRSRSNWATAVQPYKIQFARVRREELIDLYHRICRPENVWLAVGGQIKPGEAAQAWEEKNGDWKPGKLPKPSLDQAPPVEVVDVPGREAMIELRGKEMAGSDPAISTRLLAIFALGSGKGSAMFEKLREEKRWSYRQESLLWPTTNGFAPRFIMASGDKTPGPELAKSMREELIGAIKAWTEADVARARGMAEGVLLRGIRMSPLYFNPSWPIEGSVDDQVFLAGYWQMKTGRPWDPRKLLGQMSLATVDEVKDAALDMLTTAIPHVIPARG
jgi:hypothetical protein